VVAAVVDEVLFPIVVAADSVDTTTKAQGIAVPTSMVAQEHTEEIEGMVGAGVEGDGRMLPTQPNYLAPRFPHGGYGEADGYRQPHTGHQLAAGLPHQGGLHSRPDETRQLQGGAQPS